MAMLDTLRASQQLQAAGIPAEQAEVLVTTFAEDFGASLATRDDLDREIALLRSDLALAEQRLLNRIYLAVGAAATFLTAVIALATTVIVALG